MLEEAHRSQVMVSGLSATLTVVRAPMIIRQAGADILIEAVDQLGNRAFLAIDIDACHSLWANRALDPAEELEDLAAVGSWERWSDGIVRRLTFI